ncbi:hypothetical protein GGTG_12169 [Gaeumannomyces tritici R3-111a-1]|uniref:Uncharacterized protein n=1 Tax=Gaeumannomyces tritici (strain R3-111a-1) TaxID=644352 RepID=J3PF90_GAET3|nr:hypothetical protein GGTG_12169 [Gaeumannomyces tritici R3-111a-1]EJT69992.1 hypothetical protein GGTG_12169 [Gaeumannomyces tritici R3-111a-1]
MDKIKRLEKRLAEEREKLERREGEQQAEAKQKESQRLERLITKALSRATDSKNPSVPDYPSNLRSFAQARYRHSIRHLSLPALVFASRHIPYNTWQDLERHRPELFSSTVGKLNGKCKVLLKSQWPFWYQTLAEPAQADPAEPEQADLRVPKLATLFLTELLVHKHSGDINYLSAHIQQFYQPDQNQQPNLGSTANSTWRQDAQPAALDADGTLFSTEEFQARKRQRLNPPQDFQPTTAKADHPHLSSPSVRAVGIQPTDPTVHEALQAPWGVNSASNADVVSPGHNFGLQSGTATTALPPVANPLANNEPLGEVLPQSPPRKAKFYAIHPDLVSKEVSSCLRLVVPDAAHEQALITGTAYIDNAYRDFLIGHNSSVLFLQGDVEVNKDEDGSLMRDMTALADAGVGPIPATS